MSAALALGIYSSHEAALKQAEQGTAKTKYYPNKDNIAVYNKLKNKQSRFIRQS